MSNSHYRDFSLFAAADATFFQQVVDPEGHDPTTFGL